jgi:general secretion pathway protein G
MDAMRRHGFTIIELLVVLTVLALLLTVAAPRYLQHVESAKEAALRENLHAMRDAIDKFYADRGAYPAALDDLVEHRYLRALPVDPLTQRADSWLLVAPKGTSRGVFDVKSGAKGTSRNGSTYAAW